MGDRKRCLAAESIQGRGDTPKAPAARFYAVSDSIKSEEECWCGGEHAA